MAVRKEGAQARPRVVALPPDATAMDKVLFEKLLEVEARQHVLGAGMQALMPVLEKLLKTVAALVDPPKPKVATYEELYKEEAGASDEDEATIEAPMPTVTHRPGWWRMRRKQD